MYGLSFFFFLEDKADILGFLLNYLNNYCMDFN